MREIHADTIRETVARLCQEASCLLPEDVVGALQTAREREQSPVAVKVLDQILRNADLAREEMLPLCQDTGTTVVFLEIGQDAHVTGGYLIDAINQGVGGGYTEGFLRASIVDRPFSARTNTKNNTPAIVHTEIVPGDALRIQVMPKGGGCENMSRFTIMLPNAGKAGITDFVLRTVDESGGNPCPPIIVGLGVGGTAEHSMFMAKHALTRKVGDPNPDAEQGEFEAELLEKVNALGVGPQAVGGTQTALAVHMETHPTPHCLAAGGGEPAVPLGAAEGGGAVVGTFNFPLLIAREEGEPYEQIDAFVDTGATYTWIPADTLEKIGAQRTFTMPFILADGRRIEKDMTTIWVKVDGRERYTPCIFGDEGSSPLLGAVTLEELGLGVDPVNRRLIEVPGYLLGFGQAGV